MNERIRKLRRLLGLNQTEFGNKIDVSQNVVSAMERDGGTVTERNFNAICRAFSVNSDWLRNGVGKIFMETREALIQSIADEYGLCAEEITLMRMYLELPHEYRAGVIAFAKNFTARIDEQPKQRKSDDELTRAEKHAILDAELDAEEAAEKRGTATSLVSTGTNGTSKNFGNGLE